MIVYTVAHEDKHLYAYDVARGLDEWAGSSDAWVEGKPVEDAPGWILSSLLSDPGWKLRWAVTEEGDKAGFAIERPEEDDWLEGMVLWIAPAERGMGAAGGLFSQIRALAKAEGARGIAFSTTLPVMCEFAQRAGFHEVNGQMHLSKPVRRWRREV